MYCKFEHQSWICCCCHGHKGDYLVMPSSCRSSVLTISSNSSFFQILRVPSGLFPILNFIVVQNILIFNITSFVNTMNVNSFMFNMFQHMIILLMFLPMHYIWINFNDFVLHSLLDPRIINEWEDLNEHWPFYCYDNEWECCFSLNCFTLCTHVEWSCSLIDISIS